MAIKHVASAAFVLLAGLLGSCGGDTPRFDPASFMRATGPPAGRPLAPGPLLVTRGSVVGPVAVDARHLVAVVGPIEAETTVPRLVQRELPRRPAPAPPGDVDPAQGPASPAARV